MVDEDLGAQDAELLPLHAEARSSRHGRGVVLRVSVRSGPADWQGMMGRLTDREAMRLVTELQGALDAIAEVEEAQLVEPEWFEAVSFVVRGMPPKMSLSGALRQIGVGYGDDAMMFAQRVGLEALRRGEWTEDLAGVLVEMEGPGDGEGSGGGGSDSIGE